VPAFIIACYHIETRCCNRWFIICGSRKGACWPFVNAFGDYDVILDFVEFNQRFFNFDITVCAFAQILELMGGFTFEILRCRVGNEAIASHFILLLFLCFLHNWRFLIGIFKRLAHLLLPSSY
jgi:hypothetical protein